MGHNVDLSNSADLTFTWRGAWLGLAAYIVVVLIVYLVLR